MLSESLSVPAVPTMPLLEVDQVARWLRMSPEFVRRLLRAGTLIGIRFGRNWRIDPREVQAYINRQRRAMTGAPPGAERRRNERET
jgi:excisionase family DNA binding protein